MAWNYDTISRTLSEMARENYEDMVKAFLAMELSIKNKSLLDTLYQDFMGIDDLSLVSEDLRLRADGYQEQLQEEVTDLLDKLYRTGEGASFIMEVIASNNISESLAQYEVLNEEDYSSLTLETLQDIIQKGVVFNESRLFWRCDLSRLAERFVRQEKPFLTTVCDNFDG